MSVSSAADDEQRRASAAASLQEGQYLGCRNEYSSQFLIKMVFFDYSVSSRFLFRVRFASFLYGNAEFLARRASFLFTWNFSTRFPKILTLKKFEYWFLTEHFLIILYKKLKTYVLNINFDYFSVI